MNEMNKMDETTFYEDIDEVLGPPPARLYRYGSGVLLLALLILAGVAAGVHYREGIPAIAFVSGAAGHYSIKIVLTPGAYPPPLGRRPVLSGKEVALDVNSSADGPAWHGVALIRTEPYLDSTSRRWMVDAIFPDTTTAAALRKGPWSRGIQAGVFITTGRQSLLSRLFRF